MRNFVRLSAAILLLAAPLLSSPCARAADQISIVTTGKGSPLEWPLYIGISKGFFAANGVSVELSAADSTAAAMQQVAAGSSAMGIGGLTDPIHAIDHGAHLSILLLETSKAPYSLWSKPAIKSIAGLRKKLIIVGGAKDITRIYFDKMAEANGLKPGDYDLTYAGTTPARYAALVSGAVDAAILYPPASFVAPTAGFNKLGELSDYVKNLPFTGYAVNLDWAKNHRAAIKGFLEAISRSVTWFYDPANKQAAIDILMKESNQKRDVLEQTYDYYIKLHLYPDHNTLNHAMLVGLLRALVSTGDLEGKPDPARFIDKGIAALVHASASASGAPDAK